MGPRSREVLSAVTEDDVSEAAFPFARYREIRIAGCSLRAMRISYVGETGWELHVPVEDARAVYTALMEAGKDAGIANAGYRAIESLRLEKGMRAWGSDIGPDHTPLEAGLGWAVKLKRDIPFLGREALLGQAAGSLAKRLATFSVDGEDVVLLGRETLYRNGERVGWLASAAWGYTLQTNIGMAYVRRAEGVSDEWLRAGTYELEVASTRIPCRLGLPAAP
jgi:4-methylaminobutanoate oxidase (formaldehyde-forming)